MPYFCALERMDAAVRLSVLAILVVGMPFFTRERNRFSSSWVQLFRLRFFFCAIGMSLPRGTLADRARRSSETWDGAGRRLGARARLSRACRRRVRPRPATPP